MIRFYRYETWIFPKNRKECVNRNLIIKFTEKRPNGVPEKFLNFGFYKAEAVGSLMNKSVIPSGFFSNTTRLSFKKEFQIC